VKEERVDIKIVGRHMNVYETVKDYAHSKIAKLDRFYDQIQHIELVLSKEGNDKVAELVIKARVGGQFVAKEKAEEFYAAIDLLVDKMARQLKKQKEKLKENHHKAGPEMVVPPVVDEDEKLESYEDIVEKTPF
jgi:putative sigma-54 modulation protein